MLPLLLPTLALAQTNRGSIAGTVFDPTSAAVPGATVKVTNLGANRALHILNEAV